MTRQVLQAVCWAGAQQISCVFFQSPSHQPYSAATAETVPRCYVACPILSDNPVSRLMTADLARPSQDHAYH